MYLLVNDMYISVTGILYGREGERVILYNPASYHYITNPKNKINSTKFTDILSGKEINLGVIVLESLATKGTLF
jgi:hypothetical protein